ncbi:hypothetical protein A9X05_09045 [Mycobacterium sp. E3298]|nr:hypothetical protein [Mycobacterium sp. E3298]OBG93845.1 hypothetical protein A9X05_09045 [Mycobacterium sp. E3298]
MADIDNEELKKQRQFAELQKLSLVDLERFPYRTQEMVVGTYTKDQLKEYLKAPELEANQKALRKISRFLYNASTHYKRLVQDFATMLTLDHYLEPYSLNPDKVNKKTFKTAYLKAVDVVENMNIKHEMGKVQQYVYRDGIFYGYIHSNKESFFLQYLDPDFCKITFVEDGLFGFAFNFQYFNTYPERLDMFPDEFKQIYNDRFGGKGNRKKGNSSTYWVNLDINNTICIKVDEATWYPIPPFVGVFEDILNISDFKALQKTSEEIGNYKLLFQQIPLDEKTGDANKFLLTEDYAKLFHDNIEENLPKQVGIITGPMKVEAINFDKDTTDKNRVMDSIRQFWSNAGVDQKLFSGDTSGSVGLNASIRTDEAVAFTLLKQIERWLNKYAKQNINGIYKFRVKMPEITIFNQEELRQQLLKEAQFGLPVKTRLLAAGGASPSAVTNMTFLENEILKLQESFIPLSSAHTGGMTEGGAPIKSVKSDAGDKTADSNSNDNRA